MTTDPKSRTMVSRASDAAVSAFLSSAAGESSLRRWEGVSYEVEGGKVGYLPNWKLTIEMDH